MQKYRDYDKTKEIDKIVEEERRSKAYSKIINQSSTYQQVGLRTPGLEDFQLSFVLRD